MKIKIYRRVLSLALAAAVTLSSMTIPAAGATGLAGTSSNSITAFAGLPEAAVTQAVYDGIPHGLTAAMGTSAIRYLDENGDEKTEAATLIDDGTTELTGGWYYTEDTLEVNSTITVTGYVYLILADGCDLTVNGSGKKAGIDVSYGKVLTVYAQSTGESMGRLAATGDRYGAGIGGVEDGDGGNITISGGTVTASSSNGGPGIGGGVYGAGGAVTIDGGSVKASKIRSQPKNSGDQYVYPGRLPRQSQVRSVRVGGNDWKVADNHPKGDNALYLYLPHTDGQEEQYTIAVETGSGTNNSILRWNGTDAFVIPGAANSPEAVAYRESDGTLKTTAATKITGDMLLLNDGWYYTEDMLAIDKTVIVSGNVKIILTDDCDLTVNGDGNNAGINVAEGNSLTVYAQSTGAVMGRLESNGRLNGAGIGGGPNESGGSVVINGGVITATGGSGGAGIGGDGESGGNITVNGGTVTATGGDYSGQDIGSGGAGSGSGTVTISGGSVKAGRIQFQPTDGGGHNVYLGKLTGQSGVQSVTAHINGTARDYHISANHPDDDGLYIYMPGGGNYPVDVEIGGSLKRHNAIWGTNKFDFITPQNTMLELQPQSVVYGTASADITAAVTAATSAGMLRASAYSDKVSFYLGTATDPFAEVTPALGKATAALDTSGLSQGTYSIRAVYSGSWTSNPSEEAGGTLTVTKRPLTITSATVPDKEYDGNTTATVDSVVLSGVLSGETLVRGVDYTVSGTFYNADADTDKAVTVAVTLEDTAKADNYSLSGTKTVTADITAKAITGAVYIIGSPDLGDTLALDASALQPSGAAYGIRWLRDGAAITDQVNSSYTLVQGDLGKTVSVEVTGTGNYSGTRTASVGIPAAVPDQPDFEVTAGNRQVTVRKQLQGRGNGHAAGGDHDWGSEQQVQSREQCHPRGSQRNTAPIYQAGHRSRRTMTARLPEATQRPALLRGRPLPLSRKIILT